MSEVTVVGAFDRLLRQEVRFLEEAATFGPLHVRLWTDAVAQTLTGAAPRLPLAERLYVLTALRFVKHVSVCDVCDATSRLPGPEQGPGVWVVAQAAACRQDELWSQQHGWDYRVVSEERLQRLPAAAEGPADVCRSAKRVIVTGCYDWFHSGHVRFFEEASQYGQLHVVVGHDANIRLLKGEGHPLFSASERRYLVGAVKFVHRAYVSTGSGWLDAEPEIARIGPHIYAVNEDGDRDEKRLFCEQQGIEYLVLKRTPKEGLPRRQSTDLRGF